ncbi:hypothetical protein [Wenyingzhuangia sp. IMCC45467]
MTTRTLTLSLLLMTFTFVGFSQSKKVTKKAEQWTKELNEQIISVDQSLALNDEQTEKIIGIQTQRMEALKELNKTGGTQEEKKEINKKYFQQVFKEVLTKDQINARREAKKKE